MELVSLKTRGSGRWIKSAYRQDQSEGICLRFDLKLPVYLKKNNSPDFRDIHFIGVSGYKIFEESQVEALQEEKLDLVLFKQYHLVC